MDPCRQVELWLMSIEPLTPLALIEESNVDPLPLSPDESLPPM